MNAFFFKNKKQMSAHDFEQMTRGYCLEEAITSACDHFTEDATDAFYDALNADIKAVTGNDVDSAVQISELCYAVNDAAPYASQSKLHVWLQAQIDRAVINWILAHGNESKGYVRFAIAYQFYLQGEEAA